MNDPADLARDVRRWADRERRKDVALLGFTLEAVAAGRADLPDSRIAELRVICRAIAGEFGGESDAATVARLLHDHLGKIAARRAEERERNEQRKARFYAPR